ncbi:hypothetical protein [Streptomyces justiciae]|uniref:DUF202 domain-containing protein n=1 Tax=Streptomyces justiciae TaxID=2780140 RepID=A0ABU3LJ61_9ACTN|nr:hypothetical protein [Streptomyces justiciae]MBE8473739.1 hypothetical protein [Streptomyces justiciae]MCW8375502.1 hypothetical protein [Streptomyces justiciae]MDT7839285.1 hypothetical protein [Streptomyces justiciae]
MTLQRTAAAQARLWEYYLHEDTMIMQRGNLFLVAQSLQLVAFTAILSAGRASGAPPTGSALLTARVIGSFGVALAAIWFYVGHRQIRYTGNLRRRLADRVPDYAETQAAVRLRGPRAALFIAYGIPLLAGVLWSLLLIVS